MMNTEQLTKVIKNPANQMSFADEGRAFKFETNGEKALVEYNRDGISSTQKREIEDQIVELLKSNFEPQNIIVKTNSSQTPTQQPQAQQEQATLKTGHGPAMAKKKRVPGVERILAVASGKGGVGKSTVSVNLAISLANQGLKVGILDADIYGPSVPMLLGKRDIKPRASESKKIIAEDAHGIKFMSFGLFIKEEDPVIWRGPMLGGVLNQFLFDVDWGVLDVLIIDLPPGTGDMQLSMVQSTEVDGAIIVTTPQDVAILDAGKGLKMFEQVKVPVLGVVENMSSFVCDNCDTLHDIFGADGGAKMAQRLGVKHLGSIPIEKALRLGSDTGLPYMSDRSHEGRPVWKAFSEIAKTLGSKSSEKGFFGRLFNR
ncbi:MAG: hypothetical protein CME71_07445 [Halobacteriovorax sp.]|nr:hypothetical protein [Halobacteriovorax sp.]